MKYMSRVRIARWLLIASLLLSAFAASRCALMLYFFHEIDTVSIYRPPSAEQVSQKAVPFQNNTPDVKGVFKIVQQQHGAMGVMFSRLEIEAQMNWSLAFLGTVLFSVLAVVIAICIGLLRGQTRSTSAYLDRTAAS